MVTSSFGSCFVLLFYGEREVLYHKYDWNDTKTETRGRGWQCSEGMLEGIAHSFCAILLTFCCPYQKCKEKKADPVKRERTAGGAQL